MSNHQNLLGNARVLLLAPCVLMSGTGYVFAQADKVGFSEPPLLRAQPRSVDRVAKARRSGTNLLTAGAEQEAIQAGSEIHYILPINYTPGTINNPATGKLDQVNLRSYGDRFLAPTIVMKPGQTVRIGLSNRLPAEPDCAKGKGTNQPHCFNTTNLHSHGLWVSPTGNSDNVLLSIKPNVDFEYVYNVPEDHPTGNVEIVLSGTDPPRPCAKYDALDQDQLCPTPAGGH